MKKFIRKIIIFILGFLLIITPCFFLISKYDNLDKDTSENHNIISLQTYSEYDSSDILFIGNSYCYSSINTHVLDSLNIKTFNLGIATAGTQFYDLLLEDYYNNVNIIPKKVLILLTPMSFSAKSDNFKSYPIHRYLQNEKSNFYIILKYNRLREAFSMYKKSAKKSFQLILEHKEKNISKTKRVNNKGYYPSDKTVDNTIITKTEKLYTSFKKENFPMHKIDELLKLAHKIEKKGSEVIFFELPTYKLNNYFNNEYRADYNKGLIRLSVKYKLIRIDKNKFNKENYRNIDHMNSSGAEIATKELIKIIYN